MCLNRRVTRFAASAAFVLCGLSPAAADPVLHCDFPRNAANLGYMPDVVEIMKDGEKPPLVIDSLIQGVVGHPIPAKIAQKSDTRTVYSWTVDAKSIRNENAKILFRLSIQEASLSASISGTALAYSNRWSASGKCLRK